MVFKNYTVQGGGRSAISAGSLLAFSQLVRFPHQHFVCSELISPAELFFCTALGSSAAALSGAVTVLLISYSILLHASADWFCWKTAVQSIKVIFLIVLIGENTQLQM